MAAMRANVDLTLDTQAAKRSAQKAVNEINKITNNVAGKDISFNVNGKSFTQPLGRITASANEFSKSLEASNARVIAFGASVGIINGITDSFKFLVAETVRFEKTLKDINVILNASNAQLKQFGEGLFDVAQNTAQGFNIAADAALEFSRQGLNTAEVLKRTNDALTLTRITSLDAAEAVSGLTAAVNAFGKTGLTTTDIIDKLAAVDVKFAVSSEDLINGLERAGAVAIDAGVSLDSLIGIITSLQQTTARGGAVIGNGLKTIFTRIQRPESIRQLEQMDIRVRDLTGSILPADTILKNIAKSFKDLTQAQQSNVVQFSAGIFQANIFRAALSDLAKAQGIQEKALGISANAAGEAARKNALLNQSIAALTSQAGTGLKELVHIMGDLAIKDDLAGALGVVGRAIEGIKDSLGGGEGDGSTFAKGFVRGIGNVLTGPGMIAFAAIFTKLLFNVFKFAGSSLKDVLGVVSQKEKLKAVEQSIVQVLGTNKQVTESLNNLEGDRLAQEKYILGVIEAQTNAMTMQQRLARQLAGPLVSAGIDESLSVPISRSGIQDLNNDGQITIGAKGINPEASRREKKGAAEGGYTPGPIAQTKVPGIGNVVYNKAETIKQFPGMKQPAIMPPEKSRAGKNYGRAFGERHGFDPYASGGFIPNFFNQSTWGANDPRYKGPKSAQLSGTMLKLPPAKMTVETTKRDPNTNKKMVGWHYLEAAYRNIGNMKAIKESGLDAAFGSLNVTALGRAVYHSSEDLPNPKYPNKYQASDKAAKLQRAARRGTRRQRRNSENIAGSAYEGTLFDKSLKGQGYNETWKGEYDKDGNYIPGDGNKDANIDFFKMGHIPLEAKFGVYKDPNVMGKSIKLSSDSYIEDFLRVNGQGGAAEAMMATKRGASIDVLKKLGYGEDELEASGLSRGLVPNFAPRVGSKSRDVYDMLLHRWSNGNGYRMTNLQLFREKGHEWDEAPHSDNPYKNANSHFDKDFGERLKAQGYKVSAKPSSQASDYTKGTHAYKAIKDFILKYETIKNSGILNVSDLDIYNALLKQNDVLSPSAHRFSEIIKIDSRSKAALGKNVTSYRTQIAEVDAQRQSNYEGPRNKDPWKSLFIGSKGSEDVNVSGREIDAVYPGISTGAPQSFLGLKNRLKLSPLNKAQKNHFHGVQFKAKLDKYGLQDEGGFLSYDELRHSPYGLNAYGFEGAIEDISNGKYKAGTASAPLDFVVGNLGEAKFGSSAFKEASDQHLIGKLLRHKIGSGTLNWPLPGKTNTVGLGSLDFINTEEGNRLHYREALKGSRNKQVHAAAQGLVPNFARGLFDFDRMHKVPAAKKDKKTGKWKQTGERNPDGSLKMTMPRGQRDYIINKIIDGGIPYDVVHGVPASGKSTWAKQNWPGAKEILSKKDFDAGNWTQLAVLAGQGPSRTSRKDQPRGLSQYSDQARALFAGARDIFAMTPEEGELAKRRQSRIKEAKEGRLPDNRSSKELENAALQGRGDKVTPDYDLYNQLGDMGENVWRMKARGLVPNFVRYDKSRGGSETWEAIPDNRVGKYGGVFTGAEVEKMRNDGWARTDEKGWHFAGGGRAGVDRVEKAEREARRKLAEAQGMMRGGGKMIVNNQTGEMFHGMDHQQIAKDNNLYDNGGLPYHFLKTHMGAKLFDSRVDGGKGGFARKMFANLREKQISPKVLSKLKEIAEQNAMVLLRDDMHSKDREGDILYDSRGVLGKPVFSRGLIPNFSDDGPKRMEGFGSYSDVFDEQLYRGRSLNIGYLSSGGEEESGSRIFTNLLNKITKAAEEGNPFTEANVGMVVGPRIPTLLVKARKILDRHRARGKNIPSIKIDGAMSAPAQLLEKQSDKKLLQKKEGLGEVPLHEYNKGDRGKLLKAFSSLNMDPKSWQMIDFSQHPGLDRLSGGLIPNFASRIERTKKEQSRRVKEHIGPEEKETAEKIYDYLRINLSHLSPSFKLNEETLSFGGTSSDFESVFNHWKSTTNHKNLKDIAGSESMLNKILNGFILAHTQRKLQVKGKAHKPVDQMMQGAMFAGLVPNFASALSDAINREKAAGVPSSKIRISKSSQLKGPQNPMGLAVTNTRDEPAGISQGIRMARERGIDPKKHGASAGIVPNFAERPELTKAKEDQTTGLIEFLKSAFKEVSVDFKETIDAMKKQGGEMRKSAEAVMKVSENLKTAKNPTEYLERIETAIKVSTSTLNDLEKKDKPTEAEKRQLQGTRAQIDLLKKLADGAGDQIIADKLEQLLSDKKPDGSDKSPEERSAQREQAHNEASVKNEQTVDAINKKLAALEKKAESQTSSGDSPGIKNTLSAAIGKSPNVGGDLGKTQEEHKKLVESRNKLMENANNVLSANTEQRQGDLQKLFFMSSALAMVNGQLEEMATSSNAVIAGFAEITRSGTAVVQAHIAQKEMGGQFMESMGVKSEEGIGIGTLLDPGKRKGAMEAMAKTEMNIASSSGAKKGGLGGVMRHVGKLGRVFGRFLPVVGQLYTGFTIFNEGLKLITGKSIFEHMAGGVKRAEMAIKELGKQAEASAAAIEATTKKDQISLKIADLEAKGDERTVKQDQELFKQRLAMLKADSAAAKARSDLTNKQVVGAEGVEYFKGVIDSAARSGIDFKTALEDAQLNIQGFMAMYQSNITAGKLMDEADTQNEANLIMGELGTQIGAQINAMISHSAENKIDASRIGTEVSKRINSVLQASQNDDNLSPGEMEELLDFGAIRGIDQKDANMLETIVANSFRASEEETDTDISENTAFNETLKSMRGSVEKGSMINQDLIDIHQSHGEYKKILDRMIKQADAQSKLNKKIFDQSNSLSSMAEDEKLAKKKTLNEYNLISREAMIRADVENKLSNLALDQKKGRNDADVKMKDSLRNMAGKDLRVENLISDGSGTGDLDAAVKQFSKRLKAGADAGFSGNDWSKKLIADGAGLSRKEFENLGISEKDKSEATERLQKVAEGDFSDAKELQEALNSVFIELRDAGDKNVSLLMQMAMINSATLPASEETLGKMREMVIEHSSALDDLKVKNKLEQDKIKNSTTEELISKKTLVGATELLRRFQERGNLEESIIRNLGGELATYKVINDANQERLGHLRKHTKLLAAAVANENIEKTDKEIFGNQRTLAGNAFDISLNDSMLGSPDEMRRRKQLNDLLSQKVAIETQDLQLSLENAKDQSALLEISGVRKKQAKLSLDQEILEAGTQFKKNNDKLKLLNSGTKLAELAEIQLADEIVALRTNNKLAKERERLLDSTAARAEMAEEALKEERRANKQAFKDDLSKFQVSFHGREGSEPTLRKDEKLSLKHETLTQRIEAVKLSVNQEILESMKRQRNIQKKAEELNIVSNKITEAENAAREASLDQRIMNATVDADMQIRKFGQISSTRQAATTAGHAGATSQDILEFTEQFKELNKTTGKGSGTIDQLRVKMAEMSLSASNLGSDLMDIGIEGARTGMVQLFKDIGSGAESANEAWKKFSLGLAENILDRMLQHNVDKIIGDLTYAFTGVDPEKDANKFLIENNSELKANTEELKKLRSKGIASLAPDKPPAPGEKPDPVDGVEDKLRNKDKEHAERKGLDAVVEETKKWTSITAEFNAEIRNNVPYLNSLAAAAGKAGGKLEEFFESFTVNSQGGFNASGLQEGKDWDKSVMSAPPAKQQEKTKIADLEKQLAGIKKQESSEVQRHRRLGKMFSKPANVDRETGKMYEDRSKGLLPYYFREHVEVPGNYKRIVEGNEPHQKRVFGDQSWASRDPEMLRDYGVNPERPALRKDGKKIDLVSEEDPQGNFYFKTNVPYAGAEDVAKDRERTAKMHGVHLDAKKQKRASLVTEQEDLLLQHKAAKDAGKPTKALEASIEQYKNHIRQATEDIEKLESKVKFFESSAEAARNAQEAGEKRLLDLARERERVEKAIRELKVEAATQDYDESSHDPIGVANFLGGRIQKFAEGGFVNGPAGKDKVPAMLTAGEFVVPKEIAKNFREGGEVGNYFQELNKENTSHRGAAFTQGVLRAAAMHESHRLLDDAINEKHDEMPTFDDRKFNQLNLRSDVSLRRGDKRMSSRALANDPVMEEYRSYLMDKAAYDVQKKNEKFKSRQALASQIIGLATSAITAEATSIARPYLKKAVDWGKAKATNTVKGHMGFGEHSDAFKSARKAGIDLDYKDLKVGKDGVLRAHTGNGIIYSLDDRVSGGYMYGEPDYLNGGAKPEWGADLQAMGSYAKRKAQAHQRASQRAKDKELLGRNMGGSIPAMLTAGEGFIPAPIAKRIGYGNLEAMNRSGSLPIVQGKGGVDNVGPVGLSEGDFIIKKSSTDKLMKENPNMLRFALQNPEGFKKGDTGYYEGGIVGTDGATSISQPGLATSSSGQPVNRIQPLMEAAQAQQQEKVQHSQNNEVTNNINVNVTIDSSGNERVETDSSQGSYEQEQDLAMKIKSSVLEVIREEKRIGGELDR